MPMGISEMNAVNYTLKKNVDRVVDAGVVEEVASDDVLESRHITALEETVKALDDVEVYVVTKALVENHWDIFVKSLIYIRNEEGE